MSDSRGSGNVLLLSCRLLVENISISRFISDRKDKSVIHHAAPTIYILRGESCEHVESLTLVTRAEKRWIPMAFIRKNRICRRCHSLEFMLDGSSIPNTESADHRCNPCFCWRSLIQAQVQESYDFILAK